MEMDYDVGVLNAADVYRAFAVVRLIMSDLDLRTWKRLTASASSRRDWLTVTDAQGYIRGLCHVFAREHPVHGRRLEIPIFASVSLHDDQGVARRLFEFAKLRAKLDGCEKVHFWSFASKDWDNLDTLRDLERWDDGLVYDLGTDRATIH
ncbi:hypothetical protein PMI07_003478 [Rhizobium sp. CF080]|nr:hypothetical protein PMI07_003478 [Rhizobium sp. CF080]